MPTIRTHLQITVDFGHGVDDYEVVLEEFQAGEVDAHDDAGVAGFREQGTQALLVLVLFGEI